MLFNEVIYRDNENLLDFNNSNIILRNAVRAVIVEDSKILMLYLEKTKEYKFPGGGVENNETAELALKREVLEEAGYNITNVGEKLGIATEYAMAKEGKNNIFKMVSAYYLVEVGDEISDQKLDEYEEELAFRPTWVEIAKAYDVNKNLIENKQDSTPWIKRETRVLEILKEVFKENNN